MEEKKIMKYSKDVELSLLKIQIEAAQSREENKPKEIERFRFIFMKDEKHIEITWKPKFTRKSIVNGMELLDKGLMNITEFPQYLRDLATKSNDGPVKMRISYTIMETLDKENKPVSYRFIQSLKQLEEWEILENKPTIETIEDI